MNLKEKMYELLKHVRNNLNDSVAYAAGTDKYPDFEDALQQVRIAERKLKAVRAQVRVHMRKSRQAFQDACPHPTRVDVQVRQSPEARVVEVQACTKCSKRFDLREKVS